MHNTYSLCDTSITYKTEFQFDVIHNFRMYMCKPCENSEDQKDKRFRYTYFELLDHIYKCHEETPYTLLSLLNIF